MDLLNCAVGPFGLNLPVLAFSQHHAKNWFSHRHCYPHASPASNGRTFFACPVEHEELNNDPKRGSAKALGALEARVQAG